MYELAGVSSLHPDVPNVTSEASPLAGSSISSHNHPSWRGHHLLTFYPDRPSIFATEVELDSIPRAIPPR